MDARNAKVWLAAALLLLVVSCGGDSVEDPASTHARPDCHTDINPNAHTNPNTHATTCAAVVQHSSAGGRPGSGRNTCGVSAAREGAKPNSWGEQR